MPQYRKRETFFAVEVAAASGNRVWTTYEDSGSFSVSDEFLRLYPQIAREPGYYVEGRYGYYWQSKASFEEDFILAKTENVCLTTPSH